MGRRKWKKIAHYHNVYFLTHMNIITFCALLQLFFTLSYIIHHISQEKARFGLFFCTVNHI